jgi:ATP-dependent Clp protease ATP-binding subunit ClpA
MFERYTEKARRVIFFARYEASLSGSTAIEPGHLLLGLLREDPALFQQLRPDSPGEVAEIRKSVESRFPPPKEKVGPSVDLPLSPSAKRVLDRAKQESDRLDSQNVGTGHLLLGIMLEGKSTAAEVLLEMGYRAESIELTVKAGGGATPQSVKPETPAARIVSQLTALVGVLEHRGVITREEFIEELAGRYILPDLHATLNALLALLARKGLINENDRRGIMGLNE